LLSHPHYPSKIATTLASLVKGEVLSPEKIRATTGGIASRCTKPLRPYNHCKRTTHHRPTLNLPPLSKGGGLAARHKLLLCCVLLAIYPPFLCYKLFCRQDGGIVTPPPFQNRTIPRLALNLPPLSKVRCCRPKKFGRLPEGLSLHHPFQNRTITLAFRTAIVCVCLYGFAFKLSHLAFRTAIVCVCLYGFAFKLSHLAFRRARVCVCLVGFASIAIVVVCGRCVTASSAISVAASCSD